MFKSIPPTVITRANQSQPSTRLWITVRIPVERRKWIYIISLTIIVLLLIVILIVTLTGNSRKKKPTTTGLTATTTTFKLETTTIIPPDESEGVDTCEIYVNISLPTDPCHVHSITIGDLNNDGRIDLIHPDCPHNQINIIFNHGHNIFSNPMNYSTGITPSSISIEDIDNDKKIDILVINQFSDNVQIFSNIDNNQFNSQIIYSTDSQPACGLLIDINHDNNLDIIMTIANKNYLKIFLNTGAGTFNKHSNYQLDSEPLIITSADLNNDHKNDIIVGSSISYGPSEQHFVIILFTMDNGNLTEHTRMITDDRSYSIATADINNDNALDIIVANFEVNLQLFINTGDGKFNRKQILDTNGFVVTKVATADINKDNRTDIIFASAYSNKIGIFYNMNNDLKFNCLDYFSIGSVISYITIADTNNDQKLDIVVGTQAGIVILSLYCYMNCTIQD